MNVNRVIIGIGSNIEPQKNISRALKLLAERQHLLKTASCKKTAPIGFTDQPDFVNTAVLVETSLEKGAFKSELTYIEDILGRVRTADKFGPRTIDLDIVVWNGQVMDDDYFTRDFLRSAVDEIAGGTPV